MHVCMYVYIKISTPIMGKKRATIDQLVSEVPENLLEKFWEKNLKNYKTDLEEQNLEKIQSKNS